MQSRRYTLTEVHWPACDRDLHLDSGGVNLPETTAEKSEPPRVSKTAAMLMLIIIVCLAMLAVFANFQRFQRGDVESVVVRPAAWPTPRTQER